MNITTFDHHDWKIESFDTIGYSRETQLMNIYMFNGHVIQFMNVPETVVFDFLLAENKEVFYLERVKGQYPSTVFKLIS